MALTLAPTRELPRGVVRQLVRFGIVGCSNTLLSWCAYALLVWLGVPYLLASAIAWTLGAVNSYVLNRRWTFRSHGRWAPELVRFGAVQGAGLALDVVLLDALTRGAGVHHLIAQAFVYPATTVATFLLARQWAFASLERAPRGPAVARVAAPVARLAAPAARLGAPAALTGICALAAALRLANFAAVPRTPFYDAAVRSMSLSWHNFFYGALDPSAQLAVDKPPLDLWLQVASTKLLGFSSVSLRLPPALAGVLVVPLLYDLVRRGHGRWAGLAAALAFAVLPATVLTSRSDTMDSVMAMLLVLAAWLVVRAAPGRRARAVVAAGAVAGLAFEVKLTEAMVALPALALLAWLALDAPKEAKRRTLALAGGAFLATASMWAVIASLLPGRHPFAYGSSDGSIWKDILVYNGISRLGNPPTAATTPGLLRLFDSGAPRHFGQLIGAELLCALAVGALAAVVALRRWRDAAPLDDRRRLRHAVGVGLGVWLLLGFVVASLMGRQWPRYLEAFTPAVAGVLGIGIVALAGSAARRPRALAALGACAVVAAVAGPLTGGGAPEVAVAVVLSAAAVLALGAAALAPARRRALAGAGAALVLAAALAVPLASSVQVVRTAAADGEDTGTRPTAQLDRLSAYLRAHQGHARYETAGARIFDTVDLIVKDARPVLTLMSVGDRPLLTASQLERESRAGLVRYVLMDRPHCMRAGLASCPPALRWAHAHGTDVSRAAGLPRRGILYRLPGASGRSS